MYTRKTSSSPRSETVPTRSSSAPSFPTPPKDANDWPEGSQRTSRYAAFTKQAPELRHLYGPTRWFHWNWTSIIPILYATRFRKYPGQRGDAQSL